MEKEIESAGFHFYSNFDSGNLKSVQNVPVNYSMNILPNVTGGIEKPEVEFNLRINPDCAGTDFENCNRSWFHFAIKTPEAGKLVRLNIMNLNKQERLFSQGMCPVFRIVPGRHNWERIPDRPTYQVHHHLLTLSFKIKMPENIRNLIYIAYTYPFTFAELQEKLDLADLTFKHDTTQTSKNDVYYLRECVCFTLEGRPADLITISSYHYITNKRETRLKNLFPEMDTPRSFRFSKKKIIFISARVHPGETPASHVLNGLLNLLMDRKDPVAIRLRKKYIFKIIPCLNPDGVVRGHYRTDTRGVDLNRMYLNPQFRKHPTIFAARSLIRYYHYGYEKEDTDLKEIISDEKIETDDTNDTKDNTKNDPKDDTNNKVETKEPVFWCGRCNMNFFVNKEEQKKKHLVICTNCGVPVFIKDKSLMQGDSGDVQSRLFLYIDLHAHCFKKGIFMYGNHFDNVDNSVECMLLPKIMSLNNYHFHFTGCNFTERNMYDDKRNGLSKEGSGRVAVYKLTGLVQSYTLECNYNTGWLVNSLPTTIKETTHQTIIPACVPPRYTPHIYEDVGKSIGCSILDLTNENPLTRITHSEFHSLIGLKRWLRRHYYDMREIENKPTSRAKLNQQIQNIVNSPPSTPRKSTGTPQHNPSARSGSILRGAVSQ